MVNIPNQNFSIQQYISLARCISKQEKMISELISTIEVSQS